MASVSSPRSPDAELPTPHLDTSTPDARATSGRNEADHCQGPEMLPHQHPSPSRATAQRPGSADSVSSTSGTSAESSPRQALPEGWQHALRAVWENSARQRKLGEQQLRKEEKLAAATAKAEADAKAAQLAAPSRFARLALDAGGKGTLPPIAPHFQRKFHRTLLEAESTFNAMGMSLGGVVREARKAKRAAASARSAPMPRPDPAQGASPDGRFPMPDGSGVAVYKVVGRPDPAHRCANFLFLTDALQPMQPLIELVQASLAKTMDCQFLFVALPGQAGSEASQLRGSKGSAELPASPQLQPSYHAACLHALLTHLNDTDQFFTTKAAAARGLERSILAAEDELVAAGKRKRRGRRVDALGRKVKVKIKGVDTSKLNGALPQKFHIVAFGSGVQVAAHWSSSFGELYSSLAGALIAVAGYAAIPDHTVRQLEDEVELFGTAGSGMAVDGCLQKFAAARMGAPFVQRLGHERAALHFLRAPGQRDLQPGAPAMLLDGIAGAPSAEDTLARVQMPLVILHGECDAFVPLAHAKSSLSTGRALTEHNHDHDETAGRDLGLDVHSFGALGELAYPAHEPPTLALGPEGLRALQATLKAGLPDVAFLIRIPNCGHLVAVESPGFLLQVIYACGNTHACLSIVEAATAAKQAETERKRNASAPPQKSDREAYLDLIRSGAGEGIVNPLLLKNPTAAAEAQRRKTQYLDGRPLPPQEANRRLRGETTRPTQRRTTPSEHKVKDPTAVKLASPKATLRPDIEASSTRLSSHGVPLQGAQVQPVSPQVRVADDGSTVIFSPLTGKGQEPEDIVHHREASLAAEREAHEATATQRAQARQAQWQAADDAEVSRLQDLAYEGAKAFQAAAKKREAREAKRLEQALAGLQAEVDDPEWSLNELEEASGVVLFGPNGPMQPVLPGSMRGLHDSLASTFSELRASSGREGLPGDAAPPTDTAVTQDSSEPAGLQSRSALDAGQDEHAPLQPGSRAIAPGLLQQLGTSVSLEQLPTDMLPGPGEVNPFSPLGKALKSVAETGVVNSHKLGGGSLKSGQSAASRPYLAMATLNAGKDWLGSQGPAPAARRLLQPEQFDEVLESMGAAHDLYMFEQAGLEYQRLVSAENAIDYDSPAIAIQRCWRGVLGRRLKIGLDSVNYWYGRLESLKAKLTAAKRKEASLVGKRAVVTKRKATFERELEQLQRQRREIGRLDEEIDELVGDRESLVDLLRESKSRGASRRSTRSAASALSGEAARLGVGLPPALQRIADAAQASQVQQTSSTGKARTLEEAHTVQLALNLKKAEKHRRTLELEQDELELTRKIDGTKADLERIGKEIKSLQLRQRQLTRSKAAISGEVTTLVLRQSRELHDMKQRQLLPQMLAAREEARRLESAASAAIKGTVAHKVDTAMTQTRDTVQGLVLKAAAQYMPAAATVHALAASAAGESSLSRRMRQESMQHSFFTGAAIMLSKEDKRLIAARAASAKKEKLRIKKADVLQALAESAKIRSFAPSLRLWTVEDVCRWLDTMGMAEYQQAARDADLDGDTLADLSREDIGYALNIRSMVHLNRIAQAAAAIQRGVDVAKASRVHVKPQPDPTEQRKVLAEVAAAEGKVPDAKRFMAHVQADRAGRVEEALQGGFDPNARDAAGNTALHYAATNLNLRIIGILLQYGADINAQNGIGNTPLHNAVDADPSGDLPKALMGRGADPTLRNTDAREAKDGALGAPVIE